MNLDSNDKIKKMVDKYNRLITLIYHDGQVYLSFLAGNLEALKRHHSHEIHVSDEDIAKVLSRMETKITQLDDIFQILITDGFEVLNEFQE